MAKNVAAKFPLDLELQSKVSDLLLRTSSGGYFRTMELIVFLQMVYFYPWNKQLWPYGWICLLLSSPL